MTHMQVQPIGQILCHETGFFLQLAAAFRPALRGLAGFSHLQAIWWCNECDAPAARQLLEVAKPYQKAPPTLGIFATRSPARPNPLALTAVEVLDIDAARGHIAVTYIDAHDGTPLLDLKPYTPSFDRVERPETPEWCRHWPISLEAAADFDWAGEFTV